MIDTIDECSDDEISEQVFISKLEHIESAYIVVICYDAVIENMGISFKKENACLKIISDNCDIIEFPILSEKKGSVCLIGTISNDNKGFSIEYMCSCIDLQTAISYIPGFKKIVNIEE